MLTRTSINSKALVYEDEQKEYLNLFYQAIDNKILKWIVLFQFINIFIYKIIED